MASPLSFEGQVANLLVLSKRYDGEFDRLRHLSNVSSQISNQVVKPQETVHFINTRIPENIWRSLQCYLGGAANENLQDFVLCLQCTNNTVIRKIIQRLTRSEATELLLRLMNPTLLSPRAWSLIDTRMQLLWTYELVDRFPDILTRDFKTSSLLPLEEANARWLDTFRSALPLIGKLEALTFAQETSDQTRQSIGIPGSIK